MDGLFELLIILLIFVFPAVEAWARKRKRSQREERGGGVAKPEPEGGEVDRDRQEEAKTRSAELLPEDLWEELTGGRRRAEAEAEEGDVLPETAPDGPEEWGGTEIPPAEEPPAGLGEEVGEPSEPAEPRRADVLDEMGAGARGGVRRRRAGEIGRLRPGRLARRGGAPAHARGPHPLVGDLDRDALRRAVVYREILGPPVSMRDE